MYSTPAPPRKSQDGDTVRGDASEGDPTQPQGVADDGDRAERHRRARDDRAQQNPEPRVQHSGRDRDSERIVDEGEEQVLADVAHRGAAEPPGSDDATEVALHQRDI